MKTKSLFLTGMFFLCSFFVFSQRNPNNEILVFFNQGVSQKVITTKNGKQVKQASINSAKLKSSLYKIGINETMLEIAIPAFNQKDTLHVFANGEKLLQADMSKLYRINVSGRQKRDLFIKQLNSLPEVLYAEPNGIATPDVIPSDSYFPQQWGLRNTLHPGRDIHAEAAWDIYTGNPSNIIAIIDGGTNKTHPDLDNKIAGGDNGYGWEGHGVHVSGIAAAESNNNQGVSGVDWHARIHAQRIDNVSGDEDTYQAIVDAVNYSSNVKVLNNSWGLTDNGNPGRNSTTVRLAYVYAYNANRTMVSAMGNHNVTHPDVPNYPAGFGIGIAVGASDNNDNIANFSVRGNYIDVTAPGVGIYSTLNNSYGNLDGTSMATPFVSGIASLLVGYNPNLDNDDIENIIRLSADDVNSAILPGFDTIYGYGRVNAEQALKYLQAPYSLYQWTTRGGSVTNSTGQYTHVFIGASGLASGAYIVKRYEVRKIVNYPQSFYELIGVWGRGVSTNGWNQSNPNLGQKFCEVVPGTESTTGVTLRTYVYQVWSISGAYLGYYPTSPSNVQFSYTALGIKAPYISGSSTVCTSNQTFTLHNRPPNTTITWTKSSNLTYVSGQGTNNYTVRATGNGNGWVQADINGVTFRKTVWVGRPGQPVTNPYGYPTVQMSLGQIKPITVTSAPGNPYQYIWNITGSIEKISGSGNHVVVEAVNTGSGNFRVKTRNQCGYSANGGGSVTVSSGGGGMMLSVSPNPASSDITISISSKNEKEIIDENEQWNLEIYNLYYVLQEKKHIKGNAININTSSWKDGIYMIKATYKGMILSERVIVKK